MSADAAEFYGTRRGDMAAAILRDRLGAFWPDVSALSVLGLGYAEPFLELWRAQAYRCIAAVAAPHEPQRGQAGACVIEDDRLPFPDVSLDRVLLVHGLESAANAPRLLREVWRVLRDDGRLLVVAPNRLGLWAHVEATPFGHGQPYSMGQISRLLAGSMFRPERRDVALFTPPLNFGPILRSHPVWEQAGHAVARDLAGVMLIEAVKDAYAALPLQSPARRRVVMQEAS